MSPSTPEMTKPSPAGQTSQRSSSSPVSETCGQDDVASDDAGPHTDPDATAIEHVDSNSDDEVLLAHEAASDDAGHHTDPDATRVICLFLWLTRLRDDDDASP